MLLKNAEVISALASKNSKVEFSWSDEPLSARSKDGDTRPVDGVTQSDDYKVILNRQRFLGMPHSFRIALVTHELFHLVPYGDTHITDSQVLPPFKDGRSLLDTLGAATAMAAYDQEVIDDFLYLNNVSRAYKKFVFQLDFKSVAHTKSAARKLLKNRRSNGTAFTFEYKPEDLGFRLGVESVGNSSNYMDALSVSEYLTLYSFGVGYHWFPLTARLSRWSELHLASFVDVLYGSARYRAGDDIFSLEDKGRAHGVQLTGQVSIPLVIGFWGLAGYQVRNIQYQYKTLNISTNELQQIIFLGGAYAF